jgi:hypothetical protein
MIYILDIEMIDDQYSHNGVCINTCWAQAHFGEKARRGGNTVGREACEVRVGTHIYF